MKQQLIDIFTQQHIELISLIRQYVCANDNKIVLNNCEYSHLTEEGKVEMLELTQLEISDNDFLVTYTNNNSETLKDSIELFTMDELWHIINALP